MSELSVLKRHSNVSVSTNKIVQETARIYVNEALDVRSDQLSGSTMALSLNPITLLPRQLHAQYAFSDSDYDIITMLEDNAQKNLEALNTETSIAQLKEKVWKFPLDVENFLRNNKILIPFLNEILSTLHHRLTVTGGVLSGFILQKWSDIEVPEMEDVEVIVKVGVKDYDVLLNLWEMIDKEVYQELPPEISEKLVVSFEIL